ncbi:MAG TPA: D-alanyl-D-alanine carboxypeptidase/D-alanyl-D-alanine-endopeptidase [Edaphobacter sp.]|nr:D-alanyl-D-alanine carboxypeptidase/D-alanyl-D-alanine-endopeptidase [Edaphobacter sp.]
MKKLAERYAGILLVAALCVPAGAKTHAKPHKKSLKAEIAALLADPSVARAHWGIDVTTIDGKPIYSLNEGQLFRPASNNKIFTTATAMALLGGNTTFETKVVAKGVRNGTQTLTGDLVLIGAGDANISGRPIPYIAPALRPKPAPPAPPALRYLEDMADQIAKTGLKVVNGDVIGDDTLFPWEPYPQNWTIDDAVWGYGAPVSALTINDNQLKVTVTPGDAPGKPATVTIDPAIPYYTVDVSALMTGPAKSGNHVQMDRMIGSRELRVYGSIAVDAQPDEEEVAIEDPAEYAAIALKSMLEQRGIVITGKAIAKHRLSTDDQGLLRQSKAPIPGFDPHRVYGLGTRPDALAKGGVVLATHTSIPVREDIKVTAKVSQNLHAELFLHQLGESVLGNGSTAQGARVIRSFLESAGVDKDDFAFVDGSGLSGHDLVAPRATARFLLYASTQPWFADWKAALPVGGEDGTLASRFAKPPLKDHLFAKTGTLGEARALSGYLDCASGRTVIFSIMVNNHTPGTHEDGKVMDEIVAAIAAAN